MKTRIIAACGIVTPFIATACGRHLAEYEPLKLQTGERDELVPAPELYTKTHVENMKVILDVYGKRWQTDSDGKLLIKRKLSRDKELLWNYTRRAEDPKFVENARGRKK